MKFNLVSRLTDELVEESVYCFLFTPFCLAQSDPHHCGE